MESKQITEALRGAGLRVTAPRVTTIGVVAEQPHLQADAIAAEVRKRLGSVSTQAIYDILNALTGAGILRRAAVDGRTSRFELDSGDNHHHIVCTACGRLEDIPCFEQATPCMHPPKGTGFDVKIAEVLSRGVCADCQTP